MYWLHLFWIKTAVPWHALLFPVEAHVCLPGVLHSSFCYPVDRDRVPAFLLVQLLHELVNPVDACQ